jgi:hypothetical protein
MALWSLGRSRPYSRFWPEGSASNGTRHLVVSRGRRSYHQCPMKRRRALQAFTAALLGLSALVYVGLPQEASGAATRLPTTAPNRIAQLSTSQPSPTRVTLLAPQIPMPTISRRVSEHYPKFIPLVSASIQVFESAASGGHRASLESLGDLSNVPGVGAASEHSPLGTAGGSEVNGNLLDSDGRRWTVDATGFAYNLDRGRFRYGEVDFEGRCAHVKPKTLFGITVSTTDCEKIAVSFLAAAKTIPSNASIAIWRDYGQSTEEPATVGPIPVEGVTASVKNQYLTLSQPLLAANDAFADAVMPHYKTTLNADAKRLGGPLVAVLAAANGELAADRWPAGVQASITDLIKARKIFIADIEDLPSTGYVTTAWTQKLYDDGSLAGDIEDTILSDLGLPTDDGS